MDFVLVVVDFVLVVRCEKGAVAGAGVEDRCHGMVTVEMRFSY